MRSQSLADHDHWDVASLVVLIVKETGRLP
jgi:hypothetical protein